MTGERILRWESTERYYAARVHTDLLGDLVLEVAYGGLHNRLGHVETVPLASYTEAASRIEDIHARRTKHRYHLIADVER